MYIVAPRCIQMKPDDCSWAKLPMVVSRCMQMRLSDPRCPRLHKVAGRCIQQNPDVVSWTKMYVDVLVCTIMINDLSSNPVPVFSC